MKNKAYLALSIVSIAFGQDAWTSRMSLANRLQTAGNYTEARKIYELLVKESTGSKSRYAQAVNNLAAHLYETGDYAAAEPLYRKAIDEWRALDETGRLGVTLSNLAILQRKTGRFAQSIDTFVDAEKNIRKALGPDSPEMVSCLVNWSETYRASGHTIEAERAAGKALAASEKIFAPTDPLLSHSLHAYAAALQSNGRTAETKTLHERALAIREKFYGPYHPYVAATLTALVSLHLEQGDYAEAEPLAARALAIWEAKLGPDHPNTAIALNNMAQVYRLQKRAVEAEPLFRRAVAILQKVKSPDAAKPLANLGDFYLDRGRTAAALAYFKEAEGITRSAFGADDPQTAAAQREVARAYLALGRKTEAARIYKEVNAATIARSSELR
jgi:tetratricopeptide (TPR) repeat protein